ncbi:MAG: hypothetical protein LBH84_08840 [Prevotellaceae bacterium]|jgi:hypothetical protein|nr:hypothetical protein [Prevotellaceae bacterium]
MKKFCITIAALLLSSGLLLALSETSLIFRAAGLDVATQKYYLQWSIPNASDTADIEGFQVFKLVTDALGNIIMDTLATDVSNRATRFVDEPSQCCSPNVYTIRLVPKSGYPPPYQKPFRTMQLGEPVLDACANTINLSWSSYQQLSDDDLTRPMPIPAFTENVRYHIYGHVGGGTFNPDSAVWLATSGSATSLALPVVKEKQYHHLYVAAVYNNGSDTSYSNRTSIFVPLPVSPRYIGLDSVMGEKESVTLHFRIDPATEYTRFWAERSPEINGAYTAFEEFGSSLQTSITDGAPEGRYWFYRISAVNSCERVTASSPAVTSLVPTIFGEPVPDVRWGEVVWRDDGSNVTLKAQRYDVYRTSPLRFARFVDSTADVSISDNDFAQLPDSVVCSGSVCYRVEAFVSDDRQQLVARVRSSEVCSVADAQLSMPNAIRLSSDVVNPVTGKRRNLFEPLCSCMRGYMLYIYTPDGRLIYSGAEGWNGREKNSGNFVPEGAYIYHIKITFAGGERTEKTGTVTVIY